MRDILEAPSESPEASMMGPVRRRLVLFTRRARSYKAVAVYIFLQLLNPTWMVA